MSPSQRKVIMVLAEGNMDWKAIGTSLAIHYPEIFCSCISGDKTVREHILNNEKIHAIKAHRSAVKCGLEEAMVFVEDLAEEMGHVWE